MNLHQIRTHPQPVDGCFGCKLATVRVGGIGSQDRTRQKKWDAELDRYEAARASGIQPEGTTTRQTRAAESWSEHYGEAYSSEKAEAKVRDALQEQLS